MDPISQGVVGAAFAQLKAKPSQLFPAAMAGVIAGLAPDLDVVIRSQHDPLLQLEYHRHFTHSFIFIPVGAALCALLMFGLIKVLAHFSTPKRPQIPFKLLYVWSFLGYATHALLDVCTSYGTQVFWPFSNYRASFDIISVVDPLFTLPCLCLIILAVYKKNRKFVKVALVWGLGYLSLGAIQHHRAESLGKALAQTRGHQPQDLSAKPSLGNLLVWKTIYTWDGQYYVDAVKPGITGNTTWSGDRIGKLDIARDFPWLEPTTQQYLDVKRFTWFSSGYVAVDPDQPNRIGDIRYSLVPNQINPLWSIELDQSRSRKAHVTYITDRSNSESAASVLWGMILE